MSYTYILYGSQKGNGESIAKYLEEILLENNKSVKCLTLNNAVNLDFQDSFFVFIICSTTGNGEPPLNADKWWRNVKNRNLDKNKFKNIKYAVLGLGDSNYDKFCYMGKSIDKRINELGGERILQLCCVDDVSDTEGTIDKWIQNVKSLCL